MTEQVHGSNDKQRQLDEVRVDPAGTALTTQHARVDRVVQRSAERERDTSGGEGVADVAGIGHGPGEAVELGDDEGVAGPNRGHGLVQAGAVAVGAGVPLTDSGLSQGQPSAQRVDDD